MKILHTSDWHLGHRLHEQSQYSEQMLFLTWLNTFIQKQNIDVLLVAGDIFDTGTPSSQSLKMYYDFLVQLTKTNCKHVVITGGNHDSPGNINAPKQLLDALAVKIVGKSTDNIEDEVFTLDVNNESVIVSATPYLRDQDIRRAVEGETFDEISDRYKQALVNHYHNTAEYCISINKNKAPVIAMGHLFAVGGSICDSEQNIYVGSLGHIGANDFPDVFGYIALGHLHKHQLVNSKNHIRYSGSPITLSFSEVNNVKKVIVITTNQNEVTNITDFEIPKFREITKISGTFDECVDKLNQICTNEYNLTPWVEVVLNNDENTTIGYSQIAKASENLDLEVLKVTLKQQRETAGIEQLTKQTKNIKDLSPISVFKMKCAEQEFDIEKHQDVWDAFNEALQIANDQK